MLSKNSNRIKIALTVKKTTAEKLKQVAEKENRPIGRMLDEIIENYKQK